MPNNNVLQLNTPEDPLQEVLREGARKILAAAIEAEVELELPRFIRLEGSRTHKASDIANVINRSVSTISRKLFRNRGAQGNREKYPGYHYYFVLLPSLLWNQCPVCRGMRVQFVPEFATEFPLLLKKLSRIRGLPGQNSTGANTQ